MLMFLSPVLLLGSFLGMLRIVPLNYYGNILICCHIMLALQTVSNNEELCLNIFFFMPELFVEAMREEECLIKEQELLHFD